MRGKNAPHEVLSKSKRPMKPRLLCGLFFSALVTNLCAGGAGLESKPAGVAFSRLTLAKAPEPQKLILKREDRLAICGDSITEQRMYSRLIEDYLTVCVPELGVTVRQYGWSGERAPGFLGRMTNDCLRFEPTIATTCYGMNDHEYRPYEERIGVNYRSSSLAIVRAFKAHGARVIQGSPGCVGKMPHWVKSASGTVDDLNVSLSVLRNIGIWVAEQEKVGFADVFWPMYQAGVEGQQRYGTNYAIAGTDGVHPGWAGQTVMAYAFLKAMGLDGDLGTFTVDLSDGKVKASNGHKVVQRWEGENRIRSSRYAFCACVQTIAWTNAPYPLCETDKASSDNSIRSALALIPFDQELNRLTLIGRSAKSARYKVTWGSESKMFSAEDLTRGINLAAEFTSNPFCEAFARVDAAVAAKQTFETRQVKEVFHGKAGKENMTMAVTETEAERARLVSGIRAAFQPVEHVLKVEPVQ